MFPRVSFRPSSKSSGIGDCAPKYGGQRHFWNFPSVSYDPGEEPCPLQAIIMAALTKVRPDNAPMAPPFEGPWSPAFLEELGRSAVGRIQGCSVTMAGM
ncbi:hypothetical protein GOODEAATRI_013652 [Goodea atripinnis]|uniref:Uncharacterized protein n=1 Tax=Goodea atripinnis TaxID=208336 RepID=A0ABV0NUC8_9TELE